VGAFQRFESADHVSYGQIPFDRRFERIIGNSPALEALLEQVERVSPTDVAVLIQGETGTGKELIAHAIHTTSPRCGHAFVRMNCAAIPLDLLESELFGHEKGAFTGAIAQKAGRFELADKGTLFLDEVGDIPPALQPKPLRVPSKSLPLGAGSGISVVQHSSDRAPDFCACPSSETTKLLGVFGKAIDRFKSKSAEPTGSS
jgi:transcriptional regulator with GAF, ATPase, and Fis domain